MLSLGGLERVTYAKDPWQAFHNDFVSYVSLSAENNVEIFIKYTAANAVKICNTDSEMSESSSDSFDGDYSDLKTRMKITKKGKRKLSNASRN